MPIDNGVGVGSSFDFAVNAAPITGLFFPALNIKSCVADIFEDMGTPLTDLSGTPSDAYVCIGGSQELTTQITGGFTIPDQNRLALGFDAWQTLDVSTRTGGIIGTGSQMLKVNSKGVYAIAGTMNYTYAGTDVEFKIALAELNVTNIVEEQSFMGSDGSS